MEIMIVAAIIGLLAGIAVPNWIRSRTKSQTNVCINNLSQIDGAIQQWALENRKAPAATVGASNVLPYLKSEVVCPAGGTTFGDSYTIVNTSTKPTCQKDATNHVLPTDTSN